VSDTQPKAEQDHVQGALKRELTISQEIEQFVSQIDGLAETLPLANLVVEGSLTKAQHELNQFIKSEGSPFKDGEATRYHFEGISAVRLRTLIRRHEKVELSRILVPRSLLVSLVSQYDAFLGRLIRQIFRAVPDALNSCAYTLTYLQLIQFGSVENARDYIIDKEVESVLRESHSKQFEWLEGRFGLTLRKDLAVWPVFIELTERRNLFVHTNGEVSHQYLDVCKKHGCTVPNGVCAGQSLEVTREYFNTAHDCLLEIGVKLAQVLWRKTQPRDLGKADANLIRVSYELIKEGRYRIAKVLLDFGTETLPRYASEENRLTMVINRAQAYKWSGDAAESKRILNAEDWSAVGLKFKVCHAVLLDDFVAASKFMNQVGPQSTELPKASYQDWPIFKEFRNSPEYAKVYEALFKEPAGIITVGPEGAQESPGPIKVN
jgi:hypothetical protein